MAGKFLDIRGRTYQTDGKGVMSAQYAQQHQPVEEQRKAVGHAVRAVYLYTGMVDVAALSGISSTILPDLRPRSGGRLLEKFI